ncbi:hypothetical protein OU994_29730 [Pseudoduganella sp. SL102]|uniref:hypothetical protein n=1 Tax=Pseudoduganella sp. SL102 TaxID=2995154 RepID=UPI00248C3F46|nr:hypothetical protein [Pseudoduganella sp. SL102]WBS02374.1 hypothetical protein OU994_29730 [Pseudoduganella sp. SL102]
MIHRIDLDDDTSELLQAHSNLTGLTVSGLIDRLLSIHLPELHEVLALAATCPELRDEAANLIVSFGPEPLEAGIKRIAPADYRTLGEQFEREMRAPGTARVTH